MAFAAASERARTVLTSNKYFVLAINDNSGPWAAALAYTFKAPNFLYFVSQKTSRHGEALLNGGAVAGVIYNSQCSFHDAESIQFSGKGEVVHDIETITDVMRAAAIRDGQPEPTAEQISSVSNGEPNLVYRVSIDDAYVLDQQLFADKGLDGREKVVFE